MHLVCVNFPTRTGEAWENQRKPMSKFMMVPRKVGEYHESFNEVTKDLVDLIKLERREGDLYADVLSLMNRWSFECEGRSHSLPSLFYCHS